jgi:hypothetical protein
LALKRKQSEPVRPGWRPWYSVMQDPPGPEQVSTAGLSEEGGGPLGATLLRACRPSYCAPELRCESISGHDLRDCWPQVGSETPVSSVLSGLGEPQLIPFKAASPPEQARKMFRE